MQDEKLAYKFSEGHNSIIVRMMMETPNFITKYRTLIDPSYFSNPVKSLMANEIFKYYDKYSTAPSYDALIEMCYEAKPPRISDEMIGESLENIAMVKIEDQEYLSDRIVEFARHQAIRKSIIESVDLLNLGKFDEIQDKIIESISVGKNLENSGIDFYDDIEEGLEELCRLESDDQKMLTLIPGLDDAIGGGYHKRRLSIIVAPPGAGKTTFMTNLAKASLIQGKTAVFYTLEMSDYDIMEKTISTMIPMKVNSIRYNKQEVIDRIGKARELFGGKFIIKEYPSSDCSVRTIEDHLSVLEEEGIHPDVIYVDYAEIMAPIHRRKDKWDETGDSYEYLRALAKKKNVAVWTGSQVVKGAFGKDNIAMNDAAGAWKKAHIADLMISINQTDAEKMNQQVRFIVNKNRKGIEGTSVLVAKNFSCMSFIGVNDGRL